MTLIGIGLTAWLLPAFTRQWDDRQKAQELKEQLVTDMAQTVAAALIGTRPAIIGLKHDPTEPSFSQVDNAWSLASTRIEAKLQTYFATPTVLDWRNYSVLMDAALATLTPHAARANGSELYPRDVTAAHERLVRRHIAPTTTAKYMNLLFPNTTEPSRGIRAYTDAKLTLLGAEEAIAREVLHAHVAGYSTTFRDFLDDVAP
jgi:hypothetical protein